MRTLGAVAARAAYERSAELLDLPRAPLRRVEPLAIPAPDGTPLPARLYADRARTAGETPLPALLYLHGGGFVVGSLDSHDAICAELAEAAGAELVSVDYRLSPEHVWPAAFDDCWAVLVELLLERHPLVMIGDSAGGNLAAGLVLKARDEGLRGIVGQALIYPGLGGDPASGSYVEMAEAPGLSTADVAYYRDVYAAPQEQAHAFPLRAENLAGLPPAFITAAFFDPLRDDARAYAARLILAGVPVEYREEKQMIHAWLRARFMSEGAKAGFAALCDAVRRMANP